MIARSPAGHHRPPPAGFTLIELLAVMAIITVLLVLIRPAVTGLAQGQGFTGNVYDVDYLIRQAKAAAMAQNSFVWLGFHPATNNGVSTLTVAMITSKNGLNGTLTSSTGTYSYPTCQLGAKPMVLQNIQLEGSAYLTLSGIDQTDNVDISKSKYPAFSQTVGGTAVSFASVIAFGPDGSVNLDPATATRAIGIGLKAAPAAAANTQIAAIQVSGVNGRSTLFRQ